MTAFFETVAVSFEVLGVSAIAIGFVVAVVLAIRAAVKRQHAFRTLRDTIGLAILLGLEILVAADLVRTVTSTPSLTDALALGVIVLIRTVLSFSLQIEIEGVVPWRRALMTAPELIARRASGTQRDVER